MCLTPFALSPDPAANIRTIEYSYVTIENAMPDSLRRFKADVFQALAHPTRIAIIELLGNRELSAGDLIEELGMEQANVSQHLAVLRSRQLVVNRKAGNQVFYSVRDPILLQVLALMRSYFQKHLNEALAILEEIGESQAENTK
jgi:ArsR family transcriptional regulator